MVKDGEKLKKGDALAAIYNNSKSLEENKNNLEYFIFLIFLKANSPQSLSLKLLYYFFK